MKIKYSEPIMIQQSNKNIIIITKNDYNYDYKFSYVLLKQIRIKLQIIKVTYKTDHFLTYYIYKRQQKFWKDSIFR